MGGKNKMKRDKAQNRTQIASLFAALLLLVAGFHALSAQNLPQYKVLSDAKYRRAAEYKAGNKYQKDAILFMDMVADTHPFYADAGRRAEWLAKKPSLIDKCKDIPSDEAFVDALNDVLGPIHDGHTNLTTMRRLREGRQAGNQSANSPDMPGTIDTDHIMRRHRSYYDYHIFPEWRICYLQFNQCANEADRPFDKFLVDKRTFSSAGMLMTLARDNHIGRIIGTTSSFPPSHYGEILHSVCPIRKSQVPSAANTSFALIRLRSMSLL